MENWEIGALKPLQNLSPFPPPGRRRPLMSETYSTLLRILSYSTTTTTASTSDDQQILDVCEGANGSSKLGKENEVEKLGNCHLIRSESLSVDGPLHKEYDNVVVKQGLGDGNEGGFPSGYRDFTGAQMEADLDLLNSISDVIEGDRGNDTHWLDKPQSCIDQIVKEPGNRCSTHESNVKESDPIRVVELGKELSIDGVCAAVESCFGVDTIAELSQPGQIAGDNVPLSNANLSEEMEHGLQLKEMELESLISSSGAADLSVHVPMYEEIEEGEVFGDFMVFDGSDYDIVNDVGDGKKVEAEESPADIVNREELAFDRDSAPHKDDACASSSIDADEEDNTFLRGKLIRNFEEEREHNIEKVFCSKDTRKVRVYDSILDSEGVTKQVGGDVKLGHLAASQFDATSKENKDLLAAAVDANIDNKKKKKRGPLTKEKRAKKKAKERIKRAAKNRKLGVKRLKLPPPVVKPKVVTYCRHYLKGRCSEGEKCKFSHDTTPLTKSKPCCHFARQSCMKGDDCPFDHQLSKYPCNNYASNGFCSRGADCLFSHEISAKPVSSPTASNPELVSPSVPRNSNSGIPANTYGMSHKHVNSASVTAVLSKSTEHTVLEPVQKPAACTPKGVTFLSHGKSLQDDATKHEEPALSAKSDMGKFRSQMIHSTPGKVQSPNGCIKGAPMKAPEGINFLSFGRAPSAKPSGDTLSGMFNMDYEVNELQLGDMNNSKEVARCVKRDVNVRDDNQPNQSASVRSMIHMSIRNPPASTPRGISFLSVDKAARGSLHPSELNRTSPLIQGIQSAEKASSKLVFMQSGCLLPVGQYLNQPTQKCNVGSASSTKEPFLSNAPNSIQKALQSTLASAAKFDLGVKYSMANGCVVSSLSNHKAQSSKDR